MGLKTSFCLVRLLYTVNVEFMKNAFIRKKTDYSFVYPVVKRGKDITTNAYVLLISCKMEKEKLIENLSGII
jgi:hypothetical protein